MDSLEPPVDDDPHAKADLTFGPCDDPDCPTGTALPRIGAVAPIEPRELDEGGAGEPVRLTRRTQRFGEIAAAIEDRLATAGVVVDPKSIDESIRSRVRSVGTKLGLSDRTALGYAPDDLADSVAHDLLMTVWALHAELARPPDETPRHLRVVR